MNFIPFDDKKKNKADNTAYHKNNSYPSQTTYATTGNDRILYGTDYAPKSTDGGSLTYDFTLTEFGGEIENGFREIKNPTKKSLNALLKI